MIQQNKVPPALLLYGSWGSGKTTSARIVAAALNCEQDDVTQRPCGKCPTCEATVDGKSTDVIEIDAASSGGVEEARELRQQVRMQPIARWRVVILDECHELTVKAQQALLKILEEPGERLVFLFVTTNANKMLPTIASRCFSVQFRRISLQDIAGRLQHIAQQERFDLSPELALAIADRSQGALRDAIMLLEQSQLVSVSTPDELAMLMGDSNLSLKLIDCLSHGDLPGAYDTVNTQLQSLPSPQDVVARVVDSLTRLLILASQRGSDGVTLAPPAVEAERALAANLEPARLVSALSVVWDYSANIVRTNDGFAAMQLLVVMLHKALASPISAASKPARTSSMTRSDSSALPNTSAGASSSPAVTVDDILASATAP
jgi:DNA polymerase-3 subunit gamma/tau